MTEETIAFIGDSITQGGDWAAWFPDLDTVNFGVGGDTTDDVLLRLGPIVAAEPDEIFMLIGTNDLGTRQSVEHLVRNIQSILVELRRELPGARMLLQSILPRGREFAERIQQANIHLRQFAATVHAQYLDLWPEFAEANGEIKPAYSEDRLHLTDAGYEAWLGELRPALQRLKQEPPMTSPIRVIRVDDYARPEHT
ncbi:MAG: GDSL-type esterase/lipase family protein [Lacisediminihabitans sp.]